MFATAGAGGRKIDAAGLFLDKRACAVAGKSNTDNTAALTIAVAISGLIPALATTSGRAVPL
jgi:hypothetical protein